MNITKSINKGDVAFFYVLGEKEQERVLKRMYGKSGKFNKYFLEKY